LFPAAHNAPIGWDKELLNIPAGFAHGFCVTGEATLFGYRCIDLYNWEAEKGLLLNDPDIGIK